MDKIFDFLKQNKDLAFATVDEDGNPRLRFMKVMKVEDGKVYFATSRSKEVYKQLQQNPNIETLGMTNYVSVRISGTVSFDIAYDKAFDIFQANKILKDIYKSFDNKDLTYFCLHIEKADLFDLNTIPPTRLFFSNLLT